MQYAGYRLSWGFVYRASWLVEHAISYFIREPDTAWNSESLFERTNVQTTLHTREPSIGCYPGMSSESMVVVALGRAHLDMFHFFRLTRRARARTKDPCQGLALRAGV